MGEVTAVVVGGLRVERMGFHQVDMEDLLVVGDRGEMVDLMVQTEMCRLVNGGEGKGYPIVDQEEGIAEEDGEEIGDSSCARTIIGTRKVLRG